VAEAEVYDSRSNEIQSGFDVGEGVEAVKGGPYGRWNRHFVNTPADESIHKELPGLVLEPALYPWFECTPI
jgi:hypothetical protein